MSSQQATNPSSALQTNSISSSSSKNATSEQLNNLGSRNKLIILGYRLLAILTMAPTLADAPPRLAKYHPSLGIPSITPYNPTKTP